REDRILLSEVKIANAVAIVIIVVLLLGIYVLIKILNRKKQSSNGAFQVLEKFYLDDKVTIYILKVYGEVVKLAVSKNGIACLGYVNHKIGDEFRAIIEEGSGGQKLDATATYMKVIDSINNIEEKIDKWKNVK
ncbi:MAG: hypothetical protein ACK4NF_02080, partial [Planctomycetota bacterium]